MSNKINGYACAQHGPVFITIDLEEGTTPMMLLCPKCKLPAYSAWYNVSQNLKPTHAWKKPTSAEIQMFPKKVRAAVQDHVNRGGLCLYSIGESIDDLTIVTQ